METILFWDIDGTLLNTGRAGIYAWEEGIKEISGKTTNLSNMKTAGLTDFHIANLILEENGIRPENEIVKKLLQLYEEYLPDSLPRKNGFVLKNVNEILTELTKIDNIKSFLLTGNTPSGAKSKLTHFGLQKYFTGGGFADGEKDRSDIAHKALNYAKGEIEGVCLEKIFVIGDTPSDIECGKKLGAKTIAVATGGYSVDQLSEHKPWCVYKELPEFENFIQKIS